MVSEFRLPQHALELTHDYLLAKLRGDRAGTLRVALEDGLRSGVAAPELQLRMILPAQREVGRLWQENRISVAQEHLATSISQLVLSHLYPHLPRLRPNGRRALVACVPGELHDVGARIGADFLEMQGFDVQFLGANVPLEQLLAELASECPDLLGLSVTMHFHLPSLRRTLAAVRAAAPELPIVVGGGLLEQSPALYEELGLERASVQADELASSCAARLGC